MARLLFCFSSTKHIFCGGGTGTKWWSDYARLGLGTACNAVSSCSGLFVWMCGYKVETLLVLLLDLGVTVNQLSQLHICIRIYILYSIGCGVQQWV